MKEVGIYVHIPFCKHKCYYCDFISFADKNSLIDEYIKWLNYEIKEVGQGNRLDYENKLDDLVFVKTIYIGGGTPSFIESKYITEILKTIKENFVVDEDAEITMEMNPGTVNENKLKDYYNCGINRLSIGLQETNNALLKEIGRIHTYEDFKNTYSLVRNVGFKNINVDLMLGLPNQNILDLENSINKILDLDPEHISVYSLILEENTVLKNKVDQGILTLPEDEMERKMYYTVKNMLENNGYIHYEISNFAKKGFESKHNLDCWSQKEYMGFGAAAHSYTNNFRFSNIENIEEYINNFKNNKEEDNLIFHEKQNRESKMKEYMMLGLRKIEGVNIQQFKNKFVENPIFIFRKEIEKLVNEKLLEVNENFIKLTKKGLDLANLVWEEFV